MSEGLPPDYEEQIRVLKEALLETLNLLNYADTTYLVQDGDWSYERSQELLKLTK